MEASLSITCTSEPRYAIVEADNFISLNETIDKWSDAGMTLSNDRGSWNFEVWRHEDQARLYPTDNQMRALRDWLNKRIKD